jgi:O-methyltransferase involved in polyketide biosynthesis
MPTLPDHQKISFTAKLVALGRSATTLPFARDISALVGAAELSDELATGSGFKMPAAMAPSVEARYQSLVSAIKRSGVRQVLEFASGVSLRGLAMTLAHPDLTYVETDLPDLTVEKQRLMGTILRERHLVEPPNHHVYAANILAWDEIEAALAPCRPGEPIAVVHEGLYMYLSHAEKAQALQHIKRILARFGGLWITPDFTPMAAMMRSFNGAAADFAPMMAAIEERTGRSFDDYSFASEDEARAFCQAQGFDVVERPQLDGSYELSSLTPRQREDGTLEQLKTGLKIWEMRLRAAPH